MGGGGGSQPAGNTTTTTTNVPWNSDYLSQIDSQVQNLAQSNPLSYYPGQTLAGQFSGPTLDALTNNTVGTGEALANSNLPYGVQNTAMNQEADLAGGNALAGSAHPQWSLAWAGTNDPTQYAAGGLDNLAAGGQGTAVGSLADTANGKYLPGNGNSNPYLDATYQAAANPMINSFMTGTSPRTNSQMEAAGRFNSGANNNQQSINQQALGQGLGSLSAGIYEPAYAQERQLQVGAAGAEGQLQNTALANSGALSVQGQNAETGANSVLTNSLQNAVSQAPTISQIPWTDLSTGVNAQNQVTAQQQAQLSDLANRYYGEQYSPYQTLATEANIVGNPIPGTSQTTSPYFQNQTGNALGTAGGVLGLAKGIGGLAAK